MGGRGARGGVGGRVVVGHFGGWFGGGGGETGLFWGGFGVDAMGGLERYRGRL